MYMHAVVKAYFDQLNFSRDHIVEFITLLYDFQVTSEPYRFETEINGITRDGNFRIHENEIRDNIEARVHSHDIAKWELVIVRPNIEHNMLGIIMGRGGIEDLGATLWGQTELSVYDDSMHGIWGMSYKYNERAIVFNQKNLVRLWDVAYDGYNGGKDTVPVNWSNHDSMAKFKESTYDVNKAYEGPSMMVMAFKNITNSDPWPSPIVFHDENYDKVYLPPSCRVVGFRV